MTEHGQFDELRGVIRRVWGFDQLRPLQAEAMAAAIDHRDSVVVMPTGGGKSLCYQAPALLGEGLTLVVSPLIALMKDQVDALRARGVQSALLNSSINVSERYEVEEGIAAGQFRLLFVAPERFAMPGFVDLLRKANIRSVAVDEAHCISHWGHDFRPDYRQMDRLKEWFPSASVHAFTATATQRVRDDIAAQLKMTEPAVVVGDFDRPNLTYRVARRNDLNGQLEEILERHRGLPGIVYCIRRKDVDEWTPVIGRMGHRAVGYHAGMTDIQRKRSQDAFALGKAEIVVATVAFGMGIDRADVRFVIHAAMPKSIEHYQQETGRAGRDGAPAECVLLYTGSDFMTWKNIVGKEAGHEGPHIEQLSEMYRYCQTAGCRHAALVGYFGQYYPPESCNACDVCLGEIPVVSDGTVLAQKILSAVVRTGERYGGNYVADVLTGVESEAILQRGHHQQSTFDLLGRLAKPVIRGYIDQLVGQGFLTTSEPPYRTLSVTQMGWAVLRGQADVQLLDVDASDQKSRKRSARRRMSSTANRPSAPAKGGASARSRRYEAEPDLPDDPFAPGDEVLFDALRKLRKQIADENSVPAYLVFPNRALASMAQARPTTQDDLLQIPGVGPKKLAQYGDRFLALLRSHVGASA